MKRGFDIIFASVAIVFLIIPLLLIVLLVKMTSQGRVLYWSDRIGRNNAIFKMPKFRTMNNNAPAVATHLLSEPDRYLTPIGSFLRKSSLDELPQLFSILKGDMSFVGPRPALFNQNDLISMRTEKGIHILSPGLTGWAQINGRDDLPIPVKVEFDSYYLKHRNFFFDLRILSMTLLKILKKEGVRH
jgi:O-antigen biosynthesis protein WbqP